MPILLKHHSVQSVLLKIYGRKRLSSIIAMVEVENWLTDDELIIKEEAALVLQNNWTPLDRILFCPLVKTFTDCQYCLRSTGRVSDTLPVDHKLYNGFKNNIPGKYWWKDFIENSKNKRYVSEYTWTQIVQTLWIQRSSKRTLRWLRYW